MTVIAVPYHLDEYLPDLDLPLEPNAMVTAGLPAGDPWERMTVLQSAVAERIPVISKRQARRPCLRG